MRAVIDVFEIEEVLPALLLKGAIMDGLGAIAMDAGGAGVGEDAAEDGVVPAIGFEQGG